MTYANWYSANVNTVQRSAGRSSVAAAAYRLGERLADERLEIVHDYRAKSGILATFTVAPAGSPAWAHDPERLWNAAERAERVNGRPARELRLALPFACTMEDRVGIAETVAGELVARYGVAVSVGVHAPDTQGDQRNFHAHILFTTRVMTEQGLGAKTRVLDDRETGPEEITYLRQFCADTINDALASAGSDERVSPLSYAALGIDEEPGTHLGPAGNAKKRRGQQSDLDDINREIAEENAARKTIDELVDELAALDEEIAAAQQSDDAPLLAVADEPGEAGRDDPVMVRHEETETPAEVAQPDSERTFDSLHREMLGKAKAELALMAAERESDRTGAWNEAIHQRIGRVSEWWQNMRDSFVEWRAQLQENVTSWWERQHASTPQLPPAPEPEPPLTPPTEPQP